MTRLWRVITQTRRSIGDLLGHAVFQAGGVLDEAEFIVRTNFPTADIAAGLAGAGHIDWVVVTSPHTVDALLESGLPRADWLPANAKLAAVGQASADALNEIGAPPDLVPDSPRAGGAGLAAIFPPGPGRVLLPGALVGAGTLEPGLIAKDWQVVAVPVYQTTFATKVDLVITNRWRAGEYDVFLATSPTVAIAATMLLGATVPVVAIGPTTARSCTQCEFAQVTQAISPQIDDVLNAILQVVEKGKHQ